MTAIVMLMKSNRIKILLLFILVIFVSVSCNSKHGNISKEKESFTETIKEKESFTETIKENIPNASSDKNQKDNFYKHRDEVLSLIEKGKIFDIKVDFKNVNEDISMYITLKNDKTILKDLDRIRIGLSVQEFNNELSTNIGKFDKSKKYWEIKLNKGKLEEIYDINISKESNLLTNKDKELLMNKDKSTILRFDVFVDEQSPVRIYNHFLN